jgi:CRP/FNR family transcriptional regulator, cyclic AMP receptor protein
MVIGTSLQSHPTLCRLPLLQGVDVGVVQPYIHVAHHPKGKFLFHDGDHPDGIYLLLDGTVKVTYLNSGGDEKIISIYERGEIFGELFLGKYRRRLGSAVALSDITVGKISERHVQTLIQCCPEFAMNFIRHLADEQRETLAHTHALMHLDATQRLLGTLLYLARRYTDNSGEWASLPLCITQEDIASIACINRSTASLLINQLRKQNILGGKGRVLTINRRAIEALLYKAGVEILE